jgi:hypothetical protein
MSENKNKEQHDKTVTVYEKPKLKKEGKLKDVTAALTKISG